MKPFTDADIGRPVRVKFDCAPLGPYAGDFGRIAQILRDGRIAITFENGWVGVLPDSLERGEFVTAWVPEV